MNNEQNNKEFCLRLKLLKTKTEWDWDFVITFIPFTNVIIVFVSSWDAIMTIALLSETLISMMMIIQLDKFEEDVWALIMRISSR